MLPEKKKTVGYIKKRRNGDGVFICVFVLRFVLCFCVFVFLCFVFCVFLFIAFLCFCFVFSYGASVMISEWANTI